MPILKPEPDITPGLFELDLGANPWRVAHVRSRQEKSLARHCHECEIPFYLPLTAHEVVTRVRSEEERKRSEDGERRSAEDTVAGGDTDHRPPTTDHVSRIAKSRNREIAKSRIRTSFIPLFPSYVFLRPAANQRVDALRSNVIVNLLEVTDQISLADELGQIHALQQAGAVLVPFPWLTTGDAVRIREGAFRGYEGVIVKEKGEERLVVSISMIMQSVMVELGRESVVPERIAVA